MFSRKVIAWALYDWANSAFALSVLAALFPIFLGGYWSGGDSGSVVTARLGFITMASALVVSILAPILGTIADAGGFRKRFLLVLALIGASMTASLSLVGEGNWPLALAFYMCASVGFYSSTVFYDSLLIDVSEPKYFHFVSSLGYSLGYLGGAILLALHVWMLTSPATFGMSGSAEVIKFAFVSVGVWWAVFLLPLAWYVPDTKASEFSLRHAARAAFAELATTISHIRRYRNIVIFLLGYWLYVGGVFTVIFMAANYGQRLGFDQTDLVSALMITNFVGFPATLLYGFLGQRFGARAGIYLALLVYISVSIWAVFMTDVRQFYIMAIIIGCVQGGVQGLSRSLFATLIPPSQSGEFFGFYNMVTKASHVLGPGLVGLAALLSDNPGAVLLALLPLFVGGGILLTLVRIPRLDSPSVRT